MQATSTVSSFCLLFAATVLDPENKDSAFLRNVSKSLLEYKALLFIVTNVRISNLT
jgi:hypothetical protein